MGIADSITFYLASLDSIKNAPWDQWIHTKSDNSHSVEVFWVRLSTFSQLALINDPQYFFFKILEWTHLSQKTWAQLFKT